LFAVHSDKMIKNGWSYFLVLIYGMNDIF